jgi:Zn ribbon nucleic-acid-binding protein
VNAPLSFYEVMHVGEWIAGACPRCQSDETDRTVRADRMALTCRVCGHHWAVKRMPLDAEAAHILRRARERRTGALFSTGDAASIDGKVTRQDEAS